MLINLSAEERKEHVPGHFEYHFDMTRFIYAVYIEYRNEIKDMNMARVKELVAPEMFIPKGHYTGDYI